MAWPSDFISPVDVIDTVSTVRDYHVNRLYSAMLVMQQIIGLNPLTIEDTATPSAVPSTVAVYLDMVAALFKAISGGVAWYTAPVTTLTDLNNNKISKPSGLAEGDILYWNGSSFDKLHIDVPGKVLGIIGSDPAWVDPSGLVTPDAGAVLTSRQLIMGDGLSIDGVVSDTADLSADRTLAVAVGANSGLTFVSGELIINIGDGLELVANLLSVDATVARVVGYTGSGLEVVSNVLQVDSTVRRTVGATGGGLLITGNVLMIDRSTTIVAGSEPYNPTSADPATDIVYQAQGAVSYADSKINLLNPGVHDARTADQAAGYSTGVSEPSWDTASGWIFTGSELLAAITVLNSDATIIVQFTNCTQDGTNPIFGSNDGSLVILSTPAIGWYVYYRYGDHFTHGKFPSPMASGNIAFLNRTAQQDGVQVEFHTGGSGGGPVDGTGLGSWSGTNHAPLGIGGGFDWDGFTINTNPGCHVKVQAFAIYHAVLSGDEIADVQAWMGGL